MNRTTREPMPALFRTISLANRQVRFGGRRRIPPGGASIARSPVPGKADQPVRRLGLAPGAGRARRSRFWLMGNKSPAARRALDQWLPGSRGTAPGAYRVGPAGTQEPKTSDGE